MEFDPLDPVLDGSATAMLRCLSQLSACVAADRPSLPILELQFGDIVTVTTLSQTDHAPHLVIAVLLPRTPMPQFCDSYDAHWGDLLWDADEGRHVVLRSLALSALPDERSVLDAIMDSKDAASGWLRRLGRPDPDSCR